MSEEHREQQLDEVLDGVLDEELEEPVEDEDNQAAEVDEPSEEEAPDYEGMIARYKQTGNPHDLPPVLRDQELARQADYTRKMQALSAIRNQPKEEAEIPKVQWDTTDPDALTQQVVALAKAVARGEVNGAVAPTQETVQSLKQSVATQQRMDYIRSKDGYSPEVEQRMEAIAMQDPDQWRVILSTQRGIDALYDMAARDKQVVATQQKKAKRAVRAREGTQMRGKSPAADPASVQDLTKGMTPDEKIEAAFEAAGL